MIRVTDATSSPPSTSLTAGSRSPSWKISAASVEIEPGTMPPMSFQWAMLAVQATSSLAGEDRHREHDVVQVRDAAVERVVGDEHVAGPDRRRRAVQLDDPLDRLVEHADERRDAGARRGQVAVAVGDGGAHVEHLVDDRAHRRLAQHREHLVARSPAATSG